ncbi:AEC family transporter [Curtobacterium sp. MCSS17_011]|uniref:AEC family transporter n=1 Tax=Curtobacterium sp. MCSS17_011 TaxID=2175643 RepID=UPI000D8250A1|nr:AEC family transporter [Curtobacterium sp. MCSS17_011]PYY53180.1 AEC family transporter [Curtobacterium sp. MCSS17_011]
MIQILTGFVVIAFVIGVGYIMRRSGFVGDEARPLFSRTALYVTNPALLFTVLAKADLHEVFSGPVVVAAGSTAVVAGLFILLSRIFFRRDIATTTVGAMASGYVNANNIGIPVAVYVLGSATYVAPVILLQLVVITPVVLIVLDAATSERRNFLAIASRPFRNPITVASLVGVLIAATEVPLPDAVLAPLSLLGGAAVPLVLMAFGMSLHGSRPLRRGSDRVSTLVATGIKAIVMPIVAFCLAHFVLGLADHVVFASVVMAALPTAQNVFLYAGRYDRGTTIARDTVLLSSVASVPVIIAASALLT